MTTHNLPQKLFSTFLEIYSISKNPWLCALDCEKIFPLPVVIPTIVNPTILPIPYLLPIPVIKNKDYDKNSQLNHMI